MSGELRIENRRESDLHSCEVTYAVTNKAQKKGGHGSRRSWVRIPLAPQSFFWALFVTAKVTSQAAAKISFTSMPGSQKFSKRRATKCDK